MTMRKSLYDVGTPPQRPYQPLSKGDLESMLKNAKTSGMPHFQVPREQMERILSLAISSFPTTTRANPGQLRKSDLERMRDEAKAASYGSTILFSRDESVELLTTALRAFDTPAAPPPAPKQEFALDAYRKGFREALELFRDELDPEALRTRAESLDLVAQDLAKRASAPSLSQMMKKAPDPSPRKSYEAVEIRVSLDNGATERDREEIARAMGLAAAERSSYGKDHR